METIQYHIPLWAIPYLEYGDEAILTEEEEKELKSFLNDFEKRGLCYISPDWSESSYFEPFPIFGLPSEVQLCNFEVLNFLN